MEKMNISKIQEQFWILNFLHKNNTAYNIPSVFKIDGIPNLEYLQKSIDVLIQRHELLRTIFFLEKENVFQKLDGLRHVLKVNVINIPTAFSGVDIPKEVSEEIHFPFDLMGGNLFRVTLFAFENKVSILTIVFHHIIVDLHSKKMFGEELSEIYNSLCQGKKAELRSVEHSYFNYVENYTRWLESPNAEEMLDYWLKELENTNLSLDLPTDFERPKQLSLKGRSVKFAIESDFASKVKAFSAENLVTPFVILLSAYASMLSRLSNKKQVIIGVPMSNRRREENKNIFGCFVNIVPIKVDFLNNISGLEVIKQIRVALFKAHRNQELPLVYLIDRAKSKMKDINNSIFQTGFTFEPPMTLSLNNLNVTPLIFEREGSQLELFLTMFENGDLIQGSLEYSEELFLQSTAIHWKDIFINTLKSLIEQPEAEIDQLETLTLEDRESLIEWNNTDSPYENSICLHTKFEKQVQKNPNQNALYFKDQILTYSDFNKHANRLANYLLEKGVKVEDKIGICLDRSFEMMIAIYGTLKAGATFVPMDPKSPKERIAMVISDARLDFIFSTKEKSTNLPEDGNCIYLDNILESPLSENDKNPEVDVKPQNLAYVMFTSGSTGRPKGVMIEHHSVLNKIGWMQKQYSLAPGEKLLQKTPITFDVSIWELFWWMFEGGELILLQPDGEKNPGVMVNEIRGKNPTALIFVPSLFSTFIDYLKVSNTTDCLQNVKWIFLIGEALTPALVNRYNQIIDWDNSPLLVNTYGPTEATIAVSYYECPKTPGIKDIYIGKPIDNTKLLVINSKNKMQPVGIPGELIITGVNLARGYLNSPELTNAKFFELTTPDGQQIRAYKTGDIARWEKNGEISFTGRVDNQIKIRGHRIELGDIESKILEHPNVNETAVIVSETDPENKFLIAYVVSKTTELNLTSSINDYLIKTLPNHMVPSHIVEIESMPLTTSGKIDRRRLPVPRYQASTEILAPTSKYEKHLSELWKDLLNISSISITDNFFELGGNSLLAIRLITKIQDTLGINLDVVKIMEYPNIKVFANYLSGNHSQETNRNTNLERRKELRQSRQSRQDRY
ncbi:MAG: amino acid adenylation domain-containing protein [Prolixibacteraceae bacterium]|nr:amino acid adenylation domain-containing protein [Prolixibacteraceae bacterium]